MMPCQVAVQPMGWYVTFPHNSNAGLVLFSDSEKTDFVNSCQIDLGDEDPLLVNLDEIDKCPEYWYYESTTFHPF